MTFTAPIPTKLFRMEGYKGFKFSVDKKPEQVTLTSLGFQSSCYKERGEGFFSAIGPTREMALSYLLWKVVK